MSPDMQSAKSPKSAKSRFLDAYRHEHGTTRKVLGAFPADKADFKPHERSNSALMLAWTFVVEEQFMLRAAKGEPVLGTGFGRPPESWEKVLEAFDQSHNALTNALEDPHNENLEGTATFYVAPKQTGDIPLEQFLMFMLHDQIHHRGQLSVYLRMTGGKVPSIYGPTADEPWN
jgi:uncharacterized damage-inducible protein DinB